MERLKRVKQEFMPQEARRIVFHGLLQLRAEF
jgi:hypothetical protein